jgi:hypothetical protein
MKFWERILDNGGGLDWRRDEAVIDKEGKWKCWKWGRLGYLVSFDGSYSIKLIQNLSCS